MRKRAVGLLKRWRSTRETIAWSFPYVPVFESVNLSNVSIRGPDSLHNKNLIYRNTEIKKQWAWANKE